MGNCHAQGRVTLPPGRLSRSVGSTDLSLSPPLGVPDPLNKRPPPTTQSPKRSPTTQELGDHGAKAARSPSATKTPQPLGIGDTTGIDCTGGCHWAPRSGPPGPTTAVPTARAEHRGADTAEPPAGEGPLSLDLAPRLSLDLQQPRGALSI